MLRRYLSQLAGRLHETVAVSGKQYDVDSMTNISPSVIAKVGKGLHLKENHPLCIVKERIRKYFCATKIGLDNSSRSEEGPHWIDHIDPVVTMKQNFDDLLFPRDHVGRTMHDSYYINNTWMLRTHLTANEREIMQKTGSRHFLIAGDVYRRDEIDSRHYPVFHQIEGVKLFSPKELEVRPDSEVSEIGMQPLQFGHERSQVHAVVADLKRTVSGLLGHLFGEQVPVRWQPCYFPFTQPSLEVEVLHRQQWIEVCGSGVLQQPFVDGSGHGNSVGWAFGLGLERLAMVLFDIPDIRLFWSEDCRFLDQFRSEDEKMRFVSFSKYPPIRRDLSFWLQSNFEPNALYELARTHGNDLIEDMALVDEYTEPVTGRKSACYRIVYRAMDRSLTDDQVNEIQDQIRESCIQILGLSLR